MNTCAKVDAAQAVELHHQGLDTAAIAARFGCRRPAVTRALKQAGIILKPTEAMQCDRLADLVAEGASIPQAAASMGLSRTRGIALWNRIRAELGPQAV